MKKLLLILSSIYSFQAFAMPTIAVPDLKIDEQANLNQEVNDPAVTKTVVRTLPKFTADIRGVLVTSGQFKVVDVKNYPAGFNYTCNVSSCTWPGGGKGCVVFAGMPTILHSYHYEIKLFVKTFFKIKGLDQQLNRIDSSIIDYYTAGKSGVSENVLRQAFNMYPNPAKTSVEIELGNMASDNTEIIIYDVAGKILIKKATLSNDKQLIDLSALPKGLYFVAVSGNEKQQTQKLILN